MYEKEYKDAYTEAWRYTYYETMRWVQKQRRLQQQRRMPPIAEETPEQMEEVNRMSKS